MTSTVFQVADRYDAIQYTGSNKDDLAAVIPQYSFVAESGAGLQFQAGAGTWFCPPDGWVVWSPRFEVVVAQFNDSAAYETAYVVVPGSAALEGINDELEALQTAITDAVQSTGAATFNFGVGNTNVQVPIQPAMPNSSYSPYAQLFGGISLGALSVTAVTPVDADTVQVTVNNSGLLALGASVLVTVTG